MQCACRASHSCATHLLVCKGRPSCWAIPLKEAGIISIVINAASLPDAFEPGSDPDSSLHCEPTTTTSDSDGRNIVDQSLIGTVSLCVCASVRLQSDESYSHTNDVTYLEDIYTESFNVRSNVRFVQLTIDLSLRVFSLCHMISSLMQWADSKDASGNYNERDTTLNQLPTEMDGTSIPVLG